MKVTDHIKNAQGKTLISYEILPPVKGKNMGDLYLHLDPLMEYKPAFINVTYHRAEEVFIPNADGTYKRIEIRKRPGTVGICAALMNHYDVDPVPHLICGGFSQEDTENALIDLHYLGIHNILALRGDAAVNEKSFTVHPNGNAHASDLVSQINLLNKGVYLEDNIVKGEQTSFCIGVAGYPEKHSEAANLDADIATLKQKVANGADYITTQMFFDNQHYFDFVEKCRAADINVPIIPGLKALINHKQLSVIPNIFHVDIPQALNEALLQAKTKADCVSVGTDWLIQQSKELMAAGVPVLHYYTMGQSPIIQNVLKHVI